MDAQILFADGPAVRLGSLDDLLNNPGLWAIVAVTDRAARCQRVTDQLRADFAAKSTTFTWELQTETQSLGSAHVVIARVVEPTA